MRKITYTTALAIALAASPALATNGIRMIGFGPVQESMGGVSVGAGLDAATVLTNPANMAGLPGRVDFGATYFSADVKYTAASLAPGVIASTGEQESDRKPGPVPAFGLVIPLNDEVRFGLGAYGVAGLGTDYPYNVADNTAYTNYAQMRFAPGLSWRINDLVSVGGTVNLYYSSLGYNVGGQSFGQVTHNDSTNFGIGGTVGVRVTPMKALSIGIAYESEGFHPTFKYNTPQFTFDPDGPGPGGPITIPANVEELTFNSPQVLSGGIGFQVTPALLVAADVQWINWSGVLGDDQPEYEVSNPTSLPFDVEWEDQVVFKIGAQLAASDAFRIRLGYDYGKQPLNEDKAIQNIAFPAIAEHHITAGLGWNATPKLAINLGAVYAPEVKLSGTDPNFAATYEVKMSQFSLDAGISYVF